MSLNRKIDASAREVVVELGNCLIDELRGVRVRRKDTGDFSRKQPSFSLVRSLGNFSFVTFCGAKRD